MKKDHVHKYERRKLGGWKTKGPDVYKCTIPGCTHYMINLDMVVGRYSQCWGILGLNGRGQIIDCPNEVEMTRYLVFNEKRKHPLCEECKEKRKQKRKEKVFGEMTEEEKIKQEILDLKREKAIERLLSGIKTIDDDEDEDE